jgi:putative phage-type endonuclease
MEVKKMSKRFEFVKAPQRSPEWLALRKDGLGASDMAAVMGVSPYATPYSLYLEKRGEGPERKVGAAANRGVLLEDAVATFYELERGVKLRKSNGVVRLKAEPRFFASLDRTIAGEPKGIVEIKTSASPRWSMWPVPPEVVIQTTWQMGIVGADWCDVAVLLGGLVFRIERVTFDLFLWDALQAAARNFLEQVEAGTPPSLHPDDAAAYAFATPQKVEEWVAATDDIERVYEQYREACTEVHFSEQKRDALEIAIKEAIGEHAGIAGSNWQISWKQSRPSEVTNWKLVAEASGALPQVIGTYTDIRPGSRRFVVKDGGMHD